MKVNSKDNKKKQEPFDQLLEDFERIFGQLPSTKKERGVAMIPPRPLPTKRWKVHPQTTKPQTPRQQLQQQLEPLNLEQVLKAIRAKLEKENNKNQITPTQPKTKAQPKAPKRIGFNPSGATKKELQALFEIVLKELRTPQYAGSVIMCYVSPEMKEQLIKHGLWQTCKSYCVEYRRVGCCHFGRKFTKDGQESFRVLKREDVERYMAENQSPPGASSLPKAKVMKKKPVLDTVQPPTREQARIRLLETEVSNLRKKESNSQEQKTKLAKTVLELTAESETAKEQLRKLRISTDNRIGNLKEKLVMERKKLASDIKSKQIEVSEFSQQLEQSKKSIVDLKQKLKERMERISRDKKERKILSETLKGTQQVLIQHQTKLEQEKRKRETEGRALIDATHVIKDQEGQLIKQSSGIKSLYQRISDFEKQVRKLDADKNNLHSANDILLTKAEDYEQQVIQLRKTTRVYSTLKDIMEHIVSLEEEGELILYVKMKVSFYNQLVSLSLFREGDVSHSLMGYDVEVCEDHNLDACTEIVVAEELEEETKEMTVVDPREKPAIEYSTSKSVSIQKIKPLSILMFATVLLAIGMAIRYYVFQ